MFPFRTVDVHDHHSQWSVTVTVDDGLIDCRPSEFGKVWVLVKRLDVMLRLDILFLVLLTWLTISGTDVQS